MVELIAQILAPAYGILLGWCVVTLWEERRRPRHTWRGPRLVLEFLLWLRLVRLVKAEATPERRGGQGPRAALGLRRRPVLDRILALPQLDSRYSWWRLGQNRDCTVERMARDYGEPRPYTLREISCWPTIGVEDLQTRRTTAGWHMATPN